MTRFKSILDIGVTVLVVVAASIVIWRQFVPTGRSQFPSPVEDAKGMIPAELATVVRGTGQVALIEFSDFQCPFCGHHARDVEPLIRRAFIEAGLLREVFINYPLSNHPNAQIASEAAMCAGNQGKFWEMHDALFLNQAALGESDLTDRAREVGLNLALFSKCDRGGETRQVIERHKSAGRAFSVQSTPSFFVGLVRSDGSVELKKRISGALPFSEFRSAILAITPKELRGRVGEVALDVRASSGEHHR
jgi:protein-disulfide isomerase